MLKGKKNYRGHSKRLTKRIKDGMVIDELVIRIGVEKKVPLGTLSLADQIPDEIDGIKTDVIEVGKVVAMKKYDVLLSGCSIGNKNITAGTLGYIFEKTNVINGPQYLGSNTHVFSDRLTSSPVNRDIVQPGTLDGGVLPSAAYLIWYSPLRRDMNPFLALWMILVNMACMLGKKEPIYDLADRKPRSLDFAVAKAMRPYGLDILGLKSFDKFCGIFFAGSEHKSFFCKAKYITEAGYKPVGVSVEEALAGDTVYKGDGRTTNRNMGRVIDDSWFLYVNYGGLGMDIPFDDVVMTEKMIEGGDSGTAVWLEATFQGE